MVSDGTVSPAWRRTEGRRHGHRHRDARLARLHEVRREAAEGVPRHGDARRVDGAEEGERRGVVHGEHLIEDEDDVCGTFDRGVVGGFRAAAGQDLVRGVAGMRRRRDDEAVRGEIRGEEHDCSAG